MSSSVSIPDATGGGLAELVFSCVSHGLLLSPTTYYLSPGPHCANSASSTIERRKPNLLTSSKSITRVRFRARIATTGAGPAVATYTLLKNGVAVAATAIAIAVESSVTAQTGTIAGVTLDDLDDVSCKLVLTGSNVANSGADIILAYEVG